MHIYISYPHITFQTFALEWWNNKFFLSLLNSPNSILPKNLFLQIDGVGFYDRKTSITNSIVWNLCI